MAAKRPFEVAMIDKTGSLHRRKRDDDIVYERLNPNEMITPGLVKEFGHPVNDDEAGEADAFEEMTKFSTAVGARKRTATDRSMEFTRSGAFRLVPDAIYEKLKSHPTIVFCELGIDVDGDAASLSAYAGLEPNIRGQGYRFVTRTIQEAELEEKEESSSKEASSSSSDVTLGTGEPESAKAFREADAQTLTSVIEDYCTVLIENGEWLLVIKDRV